MFELNSEVKQGTTKRVCMYVRINAAGMHAGLFEHMHAVSSHHQISWVYLTGLSAQSDLIFLVDLSVLGYGELYLLVNFFPGLFFFFYTI